MNIVTKGSFTRHKIGVFFLLINTLLIFNINAQNFTSDEYRKALWMTTRMYGGQRSGDNNWLVYDHLPAGVNSTLRGKCFIDDKDTDGYDLSGGWHDAGDHVKFGHTQFYSAYMLLKGYAEFPTGYDDYYNYEYQGYKNSGDWTWEGAGHLPNGIPDILEEVKHATDFFIKCAKNSSTFYYQIGQGTPDHAQWVTAVKMQTLAQSQGGQTRVVYKNPADASMASFCGATLALMSRVYRKFDPTYASLCLQHAQYAYDYAKAHPGVAATGDGGFYTANGNWKDDYATMCSELFWATQNTAYKTEALVFSIAQNPGAADIFGNSYGFDYSNNGDIAIYNLALLGKANAATIFNNIVTNFYLGNVQADGQYNGGNTSWGPLRYNANTALMVALWQKMQATTGTPHAYIYNNIDYVLGFNANSQSFVVGFGANSPDFPHHRNIFLRDDNPSDAVKPTLVIPVKNRQAGLLLGGSRNPAAFIDDLASFQHTESGIDYNACLVGVLAYLVSVLDPVDTSRFGHPIPKFGGDKTLCGTSSVLLQTQIPTDGKKTFEWFKDGVQIVSPSFTVNEYLVTVAGNYKCVVDSASKWTTDASVNVLGNLPTLNLGGDKELCNPSNIILDMGVTGAGIIYEWERDGNLLLGSNSRTLAVYSPGVYMASISAAGCATRADEVTITSLLPTITHDTICEPGVVNLAVSGSAGPYEWYDAETGGNLITTNPTYTPTLTSSQTYYVQDQSSLMATAGPRASSHSLIGPSNSSRVGILFTAAKPFVITDLTVLPYVYYCGPTTKLSITFDLKQGGVILGTYVSNQIDCIDEQTTTFVDYYTFNFSTPINIPAAGSYELVPKAGEQLVFFDSGANLTAMDVAGLINITSSTRLDKPTSFPGIFDLKIEAGSGCMRAPVLAVLDPYLCGLTSVDEKPHLDKSISIIPNPSNDVFEIISPEIISVKIFDASGKEVLLIKNTLGIEFGNNLPSGIYHVTCYKEKGTLIKSFNIIKN